MFSNNLLRRKHRLLTFQVTVNVSIKQKHQFIRNSFTKAGKENLYEEIKILPKMKSVRGNISRYVGSPNYLLGEEQEKC